MAGKQNIDKASEELPDAKSFGGGFSGVVPMSSDMQYLSRFLRGISDGGSLPLRRLTPGYSSNPWLNMGKNKESK